MIPWAVAGAVAGAVANKALSGSGAGTGGGSSSQSSSYVNKTTSPVLMDWIQQYMPTLATGVDTAYQQPRTNAQINQGEGMATDVANSDDISNLIAQATGRYNDLYGTAAGVAGTQPRADLTTNMNPSRFGYDMPTSRFDDRLSGDYEMLPTSTREVNSADIQSRMNPYLDATLDNALRRDDTDAANETRSFKRTAAGAHSFGLPTLLAQTKLSDAQARRRNDLVSSTLDKGYGAAANLTEADLARELQSEVANQGADATAEGLRQGAFSKNLSAYQANRTADQFDENAALNAFKTNRAADEYDAARADNAYKTNVSKDLGYGNLSLAGLGAANSLAGQPLATGLTGRTTSLANANILNNLGINERDYGKGQTSWLANLLFGAPAGTHTEGTDTSSGTKENNDSPFKSAAGLGALAKGLFGSDSSNSGGGDAPADNSFDYAGSDAWFADGGDVEDDGGGDPDDEDDGDDDGTDSAPTMAGSSAGRADLAPLRALRERLLNRGRAQDDPVIQRARLARAKAYEAVQGLMNEPDAPAAGSLDDRLGNRWTQIGAAILGSRNPGLGAIGEGLGSVAQTQRQARMDRLKRATDLLHTTDTMARQDATDARTDRADDLGGLRGLASVERSIASAEGGLDDPAEVRTVKFVAQATGKSIPEVIADRARSKESPLAYDRLLRQLTNDVHKGMNPIEQMKPESWKKAQQVATTMMPARPTYNMGPKANGPRKFGDTSKYERFSDEELARRAQGTGAVPAGGGIPTPANIEAPTMLDDPDQFQ